MTAAPEAVIALAHRRTAARADKQWALADELRDEISAAGWRIIDTADGFELQPRPPFGQFSNLNELKTALSAAVTSDVCIGVIADGWPEDVSECVNALLAHAPTAASIVVLDCGDVDGVGLALEELARQSPARLQVFHLEAPLSSLGWSATRMALIEAISARVHVVMDMSTVLNGDAISPLVAAIGDGVVAAGWRGVNVNLADEWRSFEDAEPGECDAVLSYLMAVDRAAALASPLHAKAKFYRNADLEWSLALRAAGGRIVMPAAELPCHQTRHHGYHDSDPEYRDRESRKTYDRLLQAYRGKSVILTPRSK